MMTADDITNLIKAQILIETHYEWGKWLKEIPYIKWPSEWEIKAIPPFRGAIIRYNVRDIKTQKEISVYLDCYDELGIVGKPYWEIYPGDDGEPERRLMNDVDGLLDALTRSFEVV